MKGWKRIIGLLVGTLIIASCASSPQKRAQRAYLSKSRQLSRRISAAPTDSIHADSLKRPSFETYTTNFGVRKPNMVVLHYTAQNSCEKTLQTFTTATSEVSAHYVICKDGTLHHMLNDYLRAWHAGASKWGSVTDVNSVSIGIELDNDGVAPYDTAQLNTLYGLLLFLKKSYNIPSANFVGHSDIAPGRKIDPGIQFPWKTLADKGFGLWYADTTNLVLPTTFDAKLALRLIGYDVGNLPAASNSFRMHFLGVSSPDVLSPEEQKVLYAVMMKYL